MKLWRRARGHFSKVTQTVVSRGPLFEGMAPSARPPRVSVGASGAQGVEFVPAGTRLGGPRPKSKPCRLTDKGDLEPIVSNFRYISEALADP